MLTQVEVEGLIYKRDFFYKIEFRLNEIIVDLNFTFDKPGFSKMTVTPKKFWFKFDVNANRSEFVLAKTPFSRSIRVSQFDSKWLIDMSKISGKVFTWLVEATGWISLIMTIVLLFFDVDMSKSLLDFLRIVKPITRFKYINIYYGGIVEIFLANLRNIFHLVKDQRSDENERLFVDTRASLRRFYLPVLSFTSIPDKYLLYLVLCIAKYIQVKLLQYAKSRKRLTPDDEFLVDMVDRVKIPLFCFLIFDVVFYTSHTLVHQSLIVKQDRNSYFSICLSMVMLILFTYEFILLIIANYRHQGIKKEEVLEELIVATVNQVRYKYPNMALSELVRKFKKRSLNQVNQLYYAFEQKLSTKSAESRFFESTIRRDALEIHFCAKYFNIISILKVIMMEPLYITLQMNKLMQIMSLLTIQSAFFIFVAYAAIKKKIFYNWYTWIFTLINEAALLSYYLTGTLFYFRGDGRSYSAKAFERLQTMLVLFLMIAITSGVFGLIWNQTAYIRKKCTDKKTEFTVKEEEANLKMISDITNKMSDETYLASLLKKKFKNNPTPLQAAPIDEEQPADDPFEDPKKNRMLKGGYDGKIIPNQAHGKGGLQANTLNESKDPILDDSQNDPNKSLIERVRADNKKKNWKKEKELGIKVTPDVKNEFGRDQGKKEQNKKGGKTEEVDEKAVEMKNRLRQIDEEVTLNVGGGKSVRSVRTTSSQKK